MANLKASSRSTPLIGVEATLLWCRRLNVEASRLREHTLSASLEQGRFQRVHVKITIDLALVLLEMHRFQHLHQCQLHENIET